MTPPPTGSEASRHRHRLVDLDQDTCWAHLRTATVGRVVRVVDGAPALAVVNIGVEDDTIVFRSRRGGRLTATLAHPGVPAVVQADGLDPQARTGWSVLAHGTLVPVLDEVESSRLHRAQPASWLLGDHEGMWLRLEVTEVTGREVVATID